MISNVCQAMLLLLFTLFLQHQSLAQGHTRVDEVIKNITDPLNYNKWFMPPLNEGKPLDVQIRAYVYTINTRETNTLKIRMQALLEILWKDSRLRFDQESTGLNMIAGRKTLLASIWTPHVFVNNNFESHVVGSIGKDYFLTLMPSGLVILTTRVKVTLTCKQNLAKFPFDQQICEFSIHCWTHNSSDLTLNWEKDFPLKFRELRVTEFDVLSVENTKSSAESVATHSGKEFQSLAIRIMMARRYGYYFLNYYLPSILIVIVSWVSFWLSPSASPGRITIGASTMLTFIQLCWSAQEEEQKVSQFMVYDVWAFACTGFIFLSLAEFSFVNSIDRKGRGHKLYLKKLSSKHILRGGVHTAAGRAQLRRSSSCPSSPELRRKFARRQNASNTIKELKQVSISLGNLAEEESSEGKKGPFYMFSMTPQEIAKWIDNKSKIVFPVAFIIFNIFYWLPIVIVH